MLYFIDTLKFKVEPIYVFDEIVRLYLEYEDNEELAAFIDDLLMWEDKEDTNDKILLS